MSLFIPPPSSQGLCYPLLPLHRGPCSSPSPITSASEATGSHYIPTYLYFEASLVQNSRQVWKMIELLKRLTASDGYLW